MTESTPLERAEAEFEVCYQEMQRATDRAHQALERLREARIQAEAIERRERAEMLRKARLFWGSEAREAA